MRDADVAHVRSDLEINPSLDLFKVPETDIFYNGYCMVTINPTTTGITPMEFVVPALDDYVDLNRSCFQMKLYTYGWKQCGSGRQSHRQQHGSFRHQVHNPFWSL